jgi:membrane protease YdiL (CAAX protease family)
MPWDALETRASCHGGLFSRLGLPMIGGWSFWTSAVLFSIVFAAVHLSNPGENKFGIAMVFIGGLIMCFTLWRTGNLWFAIGNHAAWDWGQTFMFGTPNRRH